MVTLKIIHPWHKSLQIYEKIMYKNAKMTNIMER
jgi:hypothetical protein